MAGWYNWADLQVTTGQSVGKTVLESLWAEITRIARVRAWPQAIWPDRMLAAVASAIVLAKTKESPTFDNDENMQNAVKAGEMFASARFHRNILRFATSALAQQWLITIVRRNPPRAGTTPAVVIAAVNEAQNVRMINLMPNQDGHRPGWATIEFEHYIEYLYLIWDRMDPVTVVANGLIAYVAGMSKLGNMSDEWRRSRLQQIKREAGNEDLELVKNVAEKVWDYYGVAFSPPAEMFGGFFAWLAEQCRAKRMTRLFVTAEQSAEQGCTIVNVIVEALRQCDDFNWERFHNPRHPAERQIQQEFVVFTEELTAMRDNPWMRFGGRPGKAPKLANLGYLGKQLLTRALGHTSLANYRGLEQGNLDIRWRAWIEMIVGQYIEHITNPANHGQVPHGVARPPNVRPIRPVNLNVPARRENVPLVNFAGPAADAALGHVADLLNQGVNNAQGGGLLGQGIPGLPAGFRNPPAAPNPAFDLQGNIEILQNQLNQLQIQQRQLQAAPAPVARQVQPPAAPMAPAPINAQDILNNPILMEQLLAALNPPAPVPAAAIQQGNILAPAGGEVQDVPDNNQGDDAGNNVAVIAGWQREENEANLRNPQQ